MRYFNLHYETYGRQVVSQKYVAHGHDDNEEALRSDALDIANKNAFAVIPLNSAGPPVLGQELASRGVLCMCTVSLSQSFYKSLKPYIFTSLPTQEEFYDNATEYICKRLVGNDKPGQRNVRGHWLAIFEGQRTILQGAANERQLRSETIDQEVAGLAQETEASRDIHGRLSETQYVAGAARGSASRNLAGAA